MANDWLGRTRKSENVHVPDDFEVDIPGTTTVVTSVPSSFQRTGMVWASDIRHCVSPTALLEHCTDGWWQPCDSVVTSFRWGGVHIPVLVTTPWDGSPWGRTGVIAHNAPRKDRGHLHNFFKQFSPVPFAIPEVMAGVTPGGASPGPAVFLGRFTFC